MNNQTNTRSTEQATHGQPASATASATEEQQADPVNKPLRSEDVLPAISAAPKTARDASDEDIRAYRAMPYERYLLTAHWRSTRNRALRRAAYRCAKCSSGRSLQVHHLTYERLGAEVDADLEVLCRGCHLGLHVHETKQGLGVYLKLISEALNAEDFNSFADLIEAVKVRCARARIPYYDGQIQAALAMLGKDTRLNVYVPMPEKYRELLHEGVEGGPITHAEACGFIAQLRAKDPKAMQGAVKSMPTVRPMTQRQADLRIALRQMVALINSVSEDCDKADAAVVQS